MRPQQNKPVWLRLLVALVVTFATLGSFAATAHGLVPRIAVCGRLTSVTPAQAPDSPIVRLGTQEPRRLVIGGAVLPQVGEEVCIWGVDVVNVNPATPDPAPMGIAEWQIAPVSSIGCADAVTATSASFVMPGESTSPLPNRATLVLPLSAPAAGSCVRIAIGAQGNPVAVHLPAIASSSPSPVTPTPRASVASLPNTSSTDGNGAVVYAALALGTILVATFIARRRSRRGITS